MEEKDVLDMLRKILNFRKEVREKGNSDYDRISNKDILLHILVKLDRMEERFSETEAKQKILMWVIPVLAALIGLSRVI
jgi:hypothetical protein